MSKIVLCDDDSDILDTTAELLRLYGHEVTTVQKAANLMGVLGDRRPDLLLQDCAMPGLDLETLIAGIRAQPQFRDLSIFLFTGSVNAQATAQKVKVEGFVEKPFDIEALAKRIERVLASKRTR